MRVPPAKQLAMLLGVTQSEAGRHMRRVIAEDGIAVAVRAPNHHKGIFVMRIEVGS
jgi:hypothetical protein